MQIFGILKSSDRGLCFHRVFIILARKKNWIKLFTLKIIETITQSIYSERCTCFTYNPRLLSTLPVARLDKLKDYEILLSVLHLPLWAHLNKVLLKAIAPETKIEKQESRHLLAASSSVLVHTMFLILKTLPIDFWERTDNGLVLSVSKEKPGRVNTIVFGFCTQGMLPDKNIVVCVL